MRYAIASGTSIRKIPPETEAVHLVRPIDADRLRQLLRKCRDLRTCTLSASCEKRLSAKVRGMLREKGIVLVGESNRGRAIGIELQKLLDIIEMRKDFQSLREIEEASGVPKSTIHYLVKYAHRGKIKKGNETIYLK